MKEYTSPGHSTETLDFDEFAEKFEEKGVPRWKARRVAISMSHSDHSTKIIEG